MQKIDCKEFVQGVAALGMATVTGISFGEGGKDMKKKELKTLAGENAFDLIDKEWTVVLIGALFVCQFGMKWLCRDCFTSYDQSAREVICQVLGVGVVWCPLLIVTCFWLAARDLKRHPGPQGPR